MKNPSIYIRIEGFFLWSNCFTMVAIYLVWQWIWL